MTLKNQKKLAGGRFERRRAHLEKCGCHCCHFWFYDKEIDYESFYSTDTNFEETLSQADTIPDWVEEEQEKDFEDI